jgi:hypothetical protein
VDIAKEPGDVEAAVKAAIDEACDRRAASGIESTRDEKLEAIAAMNRMREQIRQRIGVQSVAVELVRRSRGGR